LFLGFGLSFSGKLLDELNLYCDLSAIDSEHLLSQGSDEAESIINFYIDENEEDESYKTLHSVWDNKYKASFVEKKTKTCLVSKQSSKSDCITELQLDLPPPVHKAI
jgi:hypothetical protein